MKIRIAFGLVELILFNMGVSQMRAPLSARREPAGNQNKATNCAKCFAHKT